MKDGLLWREFQDEQGSSSTLQLVVLRKYREQIVMELHADAMGAHLAVDKTHSRLKERFYWPGYWKDVQLYCQACTSCATWKTPATLSGKGTRRRYVLHTIPVCMHQQDRNFF